MFKIVEVTAQNDDEDVVKHFDPDCVVCHTIDEALAAVKRGLALPGKNCFIVQMTDEEEAFDNDPDMDDWPAQRHLKAGPHG